MPMTREQALIRREEMMIDTAWRDKFMAGDAEARREMHTVSVAIAGSDGPPPGWNPNIGVDLKRGISAAQAIELGAELVKHGADKAIIDAALAADGFIKP